MAIYTKAGLNKLTKAQLIDTVLELQDTNDKLTKEGFRVKLNRITQTKLDQNRTVPVKCTVKVEKVNPSTGKTYDADCGNLVTMNLIEARNTNGVVDCGNHS